MWTSDLDRFEFMKTPFDSSICDACLKPFRIGASVAHDVNMTPF